MTKKGRKKREKDVFCVLFCLIALGRTILFSIFLGPELFTDFISADFIKLYECEQNFIFTDKNIDKVNKKK